MQSFSLNWLDFYLPTSDLFIAIFSIESRFHFTTGNGLPDARHRNVTFEPSRTITSLELSESSIWGGTKKRKKENTKHETKRKQTVFSCSIIVDFLIWGEKTDFSTDKQRKNVMNSVEKDHEIMNFGKSFR